MALFVARAQTAQREFSLTAENAAAVVGICRALDGLPLALELAAPRVRVLSPAALLTRLENRLGVLEGGERDLPDRQRTLRAAIDWSYELLESPERTLLARLSVFAGGWTIEAAEGVCDADLASLASLLEKSLVRSTPGSAGEPRFSMLETIREYALGRLSDAGEIESVRDRHAAYFATLAEGLEPALHTAPALDEAEREHDNVRAALTHALSRGDATLALRLCSFARLWYVRGYLIEGREWIERSLSLEDGALEERARVLYWSATLRWTSGEHELAIEQARESLRLGRAVDDERTQVHALTALGLAHLGAGDMLESRRYHVESLELARKLGHERSIANSLSNIADIEATLGNHDEAETLARESLEINRRIGDDAGTGVALLLLAASTLERRERRGRRADDRGERPLLPHRRLQGLPRVRPRRTRPRRGFERRARRRAPPRRRAHDPGLARALSVPVGAGLVRYDSRTRPGQARRRAHRRGPLRRDSPSPSRTIDEEARAFGLATRLPDRRPE